MAVVYSKSDQGLTVTTGTGAPTHTAVAGDSYTDTSTGTKYFYSTSWQSTLLSNVTSSRMYISSSTGTVSGSSLIVYGSGSTLPIFTVQGSQGEVFSVTDSLTGSLFSVNDISGLPIIETFSDSTTLIGNYNAPSLYTTNKQTANVGITTIYSLTTSSYDGAFFDYAIKSGSNARVGQIMGLWSGTSVNFLETTASSFGTTTGFTFGMSISGSNMILSGSASSAGWTVKTIVRAI